MNAPGYGTLIIGFACNQADSLFLSNYFEIKKVNL